MCVGLEELIVNFEVVELFMKVIGMGVIFWVYKGKYYLLGNEVVEVVCKEFMVLFLVK